VRINGSPGTVIGVMPQGFGFPESQQVWTNLRLDPLRSERGQGQGLSVFGRLKPGVPAARARSEIVAVARALAAEHPLTNKDIAAVVLPINDRFIEKPVRGLLYTMLGACLFVLLIACTNVASLMVARASRRTREIAIRSALGAKRGRIVAQLLAESLLLSLCGAGLGVLLAREGVRLFNAAIVDTNPPFWFHIGIDPVALAFALGTTLVAAVLSGLVPALQASRTDITEVLKDEGRGSSSLKVGLFTRVVVIAEVAVSCLLLVAAGLMIHSVVRSRTMDLGMDPRGVMTARVALFDTAYPDVASRAAFFERVLDGVRRDPAVAAAAAGDSLPGNGAGDARYEMPGKSYPEDKDRPLAHVVQASPGYLGALGIRLLAGRDFGPQDTAASPPVAIVNRSFATREWPGQDPLGRQVRVAAEPGGKPKPWSTVVGVADDAMLSLQGHDEVGPQGFYTPLAQDPPRFVSLVVRGRQGDPHALLQPLRAVVGGVDPDQPLYFAYTMDEVLDKARFFSNLFGALFAIFGASALVLASVGIYGVISFSVQQRTQEIGIRMALGAHRRTVLRLILGRGMLQLGIGLACGLIAAWPVSRLLAVALVGVQPNDPATFAVVAAVLTTVAFFACWIPANRAADTDPLVAIRYD
jgi:predicted permease